LKKRKNFFFSPLESPLPEKILKGRKRKKKKGNMRKTTERRKKKRRKGGGKARLRGGL